MTICAFILARAGSKGLPGKNIIPFMGKPLISWSIEAAKNCALVDRIIVSTDGGKIAQIARDAGAEVMMRPEELSDDTAMPKDAIRYHLAQLKQDGYVPDISILLQPTSPLRVSQDITSCIEHLTDEKYDSAATFVKSPSSPYRAWLKTETSPKPFLPEHNPWRPRQALPTTYALNGAVYAVKTEVFLTDDSHSFLPGQSALVEMSAERSVDIDTPLDLIIATAVKQYLDKA